MSKFTEEQREKAMELMEKNGDLDDLDDLDIMPTEEFMTSYEPSEIAEMVKWANLNLDRDYIRVSYSYKGTQEADTVEELVSDDEIEEALNELQ